MDQENSCVTGNRLTDCDIDADYYYWLSHTSQHLRAEKPSPLPDFGGLSSVRGKKVIQSPEVKGVVLGICVLHDTFEIVLIFAPLFRCFWFNLYL
jgi:hypothetical protein